MKASFTTKILGSALVAAAALGSAATASASLVNITGLGLYPSAGDAFVNVTYEGNVAGYGQNGPYTFGAPGTGPLGISVNNQNDTIVTYGFQLSFIHQIGVCNGVQTCGQPIDHLQTGYLADGGVVDGATLTGATAGAVQTLINQGAQAITDYNNGGDETDAQLEAYQIAIYDEIYGLTQNSGDVGADTLAAINADLAYANSNPTGVQALILYDPSGVTATLGVPSFDGLPAPITGAVPEPAAWALMLVGFGGMGVALRSRRRAAAV